jgi:hypothetical protein
MCSRLKANAEISGTTFIFRGGHLLNVNFMYKFFGTSERNYWMAACMKEAIHLH